MDLNATYWKRTSRTWFAIAMFLGWIALVELVVILIFVVEALI